MQAIMYVHVLIIKASLSSTKPRPHQLINYKLCFFYKEIAVGFVIN